MEGDIASPFPFFTRYILPHSHNISFPSSLYSSQTDLINLPPPLSVEEVYTPLQFYGIIAKNKNQNQLQ